MAFLISLVIGAVLVRPLGGITLVALVAIPVQSPTPELSITAFEVFLPICALIELRRLPDGKARFLPTAPAAMPIMVFFTWSIASGLWAIDDTLWFTRLVVLTEALLAGWVLFHATRRLGPGAFMTTTAWTAGLGATWSLIWFYLLDRTAALNLQPPTGIDATLSQVLRLGSPLLGPSNYYAGFLVVTIPITFYVCRRSPFHGLALVAQAAALIATVSRGGLIALGAGLTAALVARQLHRRKLPHPVAIFAVAASAVILAPEAPRAIRGLLDQRQAVETFSPSGRIEFWRAAVDLISQHFWLGVGSGNWETAVNQVYASGAHSALLQIFAELGIIGCVAAVAALAALLAGLRKVTPDGLKYALMAALVASFLDCMLQAQFEGVVFTWFVACFIGSLMAISEPQFSATEISDVDVESDGTKASGRLP